ncbi:MULTISPECIES: MerR family DNA-binding transcriptional regulator [unclassified Paenibacillus]|uniref:MerR family DNA-binding transcriptional regulator n=1 Tax=unclassified Paenibacillus TaxID=185978 RepID=UPI003837A250
MYSIKEVQIKSGLPASTLRYYEKEGILPDVGRDEGGRRVWEKASLNQAFDAKVKKPKPFA